MPVSEFDANKYQFVHSDFIVTKEDIDTLLTKKELLRGITKCICERKIEEYK